MKITLRSIVCGILAAAFGVVAILGLFAVVIRLQWRSGRVFSENGFDLFDFESIFFLKEGESGELVWMQNNLFFIPYELGFLGIALCVFGALSNLFGVLSVFFKKTVGAANVMIFISFILSAFYTLCGINAGISFKAINEIPSMFPVSTSVHVPFIIELPVFVAYFICRAKLADTAVRDRSGGADQSGKPPQPDCGNAAGGFPPVYPPFMWPYPPVPPVGFSPPEKDSRERQSMGQQKQSMTEGQKIELLEQYSRMYKDGTLTQEEYNEKKKELLD